MKNIVNFINESKDCHNKWDSLVKKLSDEDKEWIKKYAIDDKDNTNHTMEELEQRMGKGDLKDQWDIMNNYLIDHILTRDNGITQRDVINTYSLATSGKQSMIEVLAQTIYMINSKL